MYIWKQKKNLIENIRSSKIFKKYNKGTKKEKKQRKSEIYENKL